ncbi:intraflagellar transport protein 43 homolog B isoform X2 [Bacillus rossius redtenbacheri]|uniref:intraflagellar transport protein 43 homolog B isoform X2 n=1 Tax=Bacillus rossius redtenbacheri TaxID=93214 RepID=UPI002FDEBBDB
MDWKKNFDFSPSRKVPPQKGRRAANALGSSSRSETSVAEDVLDSPPGSAAGTGPKSKSPLPVAPPRARRTGGWAEDTTKSGKRRSAVNVIEQERFRDVEDKKVDSDDDIPVIPDLDDLQEEELGLQVADAPSWCVQDGCEQSGHVQGTELGSPQALCVLHAGRHQPAAAHQEAEWRGRREGGG